jgi:hypothetical protein
LQSADTISTRSRRDQVLPAGAHPVPSVVELVGADALRST